MSTEYRIPPLLVATLLAVTISCSEGSGPTDNSRPPEELNVVQVPATNGALFNPVDSFYAKKGENREVRIFFQDESGEAGEEYLRLLVDAQSLLARPDGTPFFAGDSILIGVRVVNPSQMLFEFSPSGLQFSPLEPARLKIHYDHAGGDINDDGSVDAEDESLELRLAIWRQEQPGDPFVRLTSLLAQAVDECDADLTGFTRYALAY
jgi:hypothetical protein